MARRVKLRGVQSGVSLLALAAVLIMASLWFVVSTVHTRLTPATALRNHNAEVLQQAKQALIGYVVKEALNMGENFPGRLPCPESAGSAGGSTEGTMEGSCTQAAPSAKTIGRLPWRTLGLDKLVDASGEPLWYGVSPNWVNGAAIPVINSGSTGQLSVDAMGNIVAVIIAPGAPLVASPATSQTAAGCATQGQVRSDKAHGGAANLDYTQYLECDNASPFDNRFVTSVADNDSNRVFNDQLVYITASEILNAIHGPVAERMQRTVAPLLNAFSTTWVSAGTLVVDGVYNPQATGTLGRFLPNAAPFVAPNDLKALDEHCGTNGVNGLLPIARRGSATCDMRWNPAFTAVGTAVSDVACTPAAPADVTTCTISYYSLTLLGIVKIWGDTGVVYWGETAADFTVTGHVPYAAATFHTLQPADIGVSGARSASFTFLPVADGRGALTLQIRALNLAVCSSPPPPVIPPGYHGIYTATCKATASGLAAQHDVTIQFRRLSDPVITGLDLLTPAPTAPHYWFIQNEWYRYAYYAAAPSASPSQSGADLTVDGVPDGTAKRFVLVLMGLPVDAAQADRGSGTPYSVDLARYMEGENSTPADARFIFKEAPPANDRVIACPYSTGAGTLCN